MNMEQPKITFRPMTVEEAHLLLEGLGHLAINRAGALFASIREQAIEQTQPKAAHGDQAPAN